jgi:hypothetical protein
MNIYQILENLRQVEESAMSEADLLLQDLVNGRVDIYDVYSRPKDKIEKYVSEIVHKYYDDVVIDTGLHAKDDFDKIFDLVLRQIQKDYNVEVDESIDDDDYESDEGDYTDIPGVHAQVNRSNYNVLTAQSYADKIDFIDRQLANLNQQQNWPEFRQRRLDLVATAQRAGIVKEQGMQEGSKFAFANPKQRPGDQVRGTERATKTKSGAHPFAGRLVGTDEAKATSQRLDPKCWTGYKKQGTKVKGGVRVNNCVPVDEEYEQYLEDLVNKYGMTTGGMATSNAQVNPADQAKKIAQVQQGVNKLKSAGANIPSGQQAVQSLMKEPGKDPVSQLDKTIDAGLGQELQNVVTKGDPNDVNQLVALIRKVNQQSGT